MKKLIIVCCILFCQGCVSISANRKAKMVDANREIMQSKVIIFLSNQAQDFKNRLERLEKSDAFKVSVSTEIERRSK
ncbi:MAG TPA: hypothetical protein DCE80_14315 [Ignavibacteriales bacterium]|nr:hypothetical protein [Ignavibacteriales bacterium]